MGSNDHRMNQNYFNADEYICIYKRGKYCLVTGLLCHKSCSLKRLSNSNTNL